jgi:hypothetical protein
MMMMMMPPGMPPMGMLPPPGMPPPAYSLPLPPHSGPPLSYAAAATAGGSQRREVKSTITGATTAVRLQPAAQNKAVTSMVPASVRVRREDGAAKAKAAKAATAAGITASSGFGLAPAARPAAAPTAPGAAPAALAAKAAAEDGGSRPVNVDEKYNEFMKQMMELGAL